MTGEGMKSEPSLSGSLMKGLEEGLRQKRDGGDGDKRSGEGGIKGQIWKRAEWSEGPMRRRGAPRVQVKY